MKVALAINFTPRVVLAVANIGLGKEFAGACFCLESVSEPTGFDTAELPASEAQGAIGSR